MQEIFCELCIQYLSTELYPCMSVRFQIEKDDCWRSLYHIKNMRQHSSLGVNKKHTFRTGNDQRDRR